MNPIIVTIQIFIAISGLALGIFIIVKDPKRRPYQIAFALYLIIAGWVVAEMTTDYYESLNQLESALLFRNITKILSSFMSATIVCFVWYFPQKSPDVGVSRIVTVYLLALFFSVGAFTKYDYKNPLIQDGNLVLQYEILHRLYSAYIIGSSIYALGFMIRKWKHSSEQIIRPQIKHIVIGLSSALSIGIICSLILPQIGIHSFYFIGTFAPALGALFWAYAFIKYQNRRVAELELDLAAKNQQLEARLQEIENAYRQLQQTQVELIQAQKMASLGTLVAGVAHEINNPVNFISSALPSLERNLNTILAVFDKLDQVYKLKLPELEPLLQEVDALAAELHYEAARKGIDKIIAAIREGTNRTTEIVKSLRQFARKDEVEKNPVDLHVGLESTLMLLENRFKKGIKVHKNYGDIPPVKCFAGQLNQVFLNLLTNAADAMNDKGEIWITTRQVGEHVEIRVKDTGSGIAAEIKDKIFDPFFTTKKVGRGMGLGLWICYQIVVEKHGGQIQVESEVGKGTEMIVILPI